MLVRVRQEVGKLSPGTQSPDRWKVKAEQRDWKHQGAVSPITRLATKPLSDTLTSSPAPVPFPGHVKRGEHLCSSGSSIFAWCSFRGFFRDPNLLRILVLLISPLLWPSTPLVVPQNTHSFGKSVPETWICNRQSRWQSWRSHTAVVWGLPKQKDKLG